MEKFKGLHMKVSNESNQEIEELLEVLNQTRKAFKSIGLSFDKAALAFNKLTTLIREDDIQLQEDGEDILSVSTIDIIKSKEVV